MTVAALTHTFMYVSLDFITCDGSFHHGIIWLVNPRHTSKFLLGGKINTNTQQSSHDSQKEFLAAVVRNHQLVEM